jgi:hypothetical protein
MAPEGPQIVAPGKAAPSSRRPGLTPQIISSLASGARRATRVSFPGITDHRPVTKETRLNDLELDCKKANHGWRGFAGKFVAQKEMKLKRYAIMRDPFMEMKSLWIKMSKDLWLKCQCRIITVPIAPNILLAIKLALV